MMNTRFDFEVWRKVHDIQAFGLKKNGSDEEYYGIRKDGTQLVLPSVRRMFPDFVEGQEAPSLADLLLAYARRMFEEKPEGKTYLDFIARFGIDATDDLMSIVRSQASLDDLLT